MTIYGTQIFWPIWSEPVGLGSIFIIDPLYTLPLFITTICAFFKSEMTSKLLYLGIGALCLSSVYLFWTAVAQQIVEVRGERYLKAQGIVADAILAGPTPFNNLFWQFIAVQGNSYYRLYIPLHRGTKGITIYRHERWAPQLSCWLKHLELSIIHI